MKRDNEHYPCRFATVWDFAPEFNSVKDSLQRPMNSPVLRNGFENEHAFGELFSDITCLVSWLMDAALIIDLHRVVLSFDTIPVKDLLSSRISNVQSPSTSGHLTGAYDDDEDTGKSFDEDAPEFIDEFVDEEDDEAAGEGNCVDQPPTP